MKKDLCQCRYCVHYNARFKCCDQILDFLCANNSELLRERKRFDSKLDKDKLTFEFSDYLNDIVDWYCK